MKRLEGKTALVTGSGHNIGRAIILKLAEEGANVIVNARSNKEEAKAVVTEARALGVEALPFIADVADRQQVTDMFTAAAEQFGGVDILVSKPPSVLANHLRNSPMTTGSGFAVWCWTALSTSHMRPFQIWPRTNTEG